MKSPPPAIRSATFICETRKSFSSSWLPSGAARGGAWKSFREYDQINAVIAEVSPYVPIGEVAHALSRWKHLTTLTQDQQETLLSKFVIEKARNQQRLIMVLLIIVSAVIIALIVYTLTIDKVRSIATLKFVGAPVRALALLPQSPFSRIGKRV